ncbi:MAG: hypothetical protein WD847_05065 [Pirellulales bacterium]
MAPLTDPDRLRAYSDALGNWNFAGYIQFELTASAYGWIRRELDNVPTKEIGRLMHEFVAAGGEIDEVCETRPEWSSQYKFHHDLLIPIEGKLVYIETRLNYRLPIVPDESWIQVVNVHGQ